jgi:hypothetical protein
VGPPVFPASPKLKIRLKMMIQVSASRETAELEPKRSNCLTGLLALLGALLGWPQLSGTAAAWSGDHYVLTYYLALELGFTQRQAFQIGSATYALDFDEHTDPMTGMSLYDKLHGADYGPDPDSWQSWIQEPKNIATMAKWEDFHAFASREWVQKCFLGTQQEADDADVIEAILATTEPRFFWKLIPGIIAELQSQVLHTTTAGGTQPFPSVNRKEMTSMFSGQRDFSIKLCSSENIDKVKNARNARRDVLRNYSLENRNPGVLLHFVQDSYAHKYFSSTLGHALAGHGPDFVSFSPARSRDAARETISELKRFRDSLGTFGGPSSSGSSVTGDYLPQIAKDPDDNRVNQIVKALITRNPRPTPYQEIFDNPDLGNSIAVVNEALGRISGPWNQNPFARLRLPYASMPDLWLQYSYTEDGHVESPEASVEKVAL